MTALFFIAGGVAAISSLMAVTRRNAVHALLYLVTSQLASGVVFFILGAPFAAVLEVIVYAGAIMVLFIFVVIMGNPAGKSGAGNRILTVGSWAGPAFLSLILVIELLYALKAAGPGESGQPMIGPKAVGLTLFGPYALGVELASMMLLAGLAGALHLTGGTGRQKMKEGGKGNE